MNRLAFRMLVAAATLAFALACGGSSPAAPVALASPTDVPATALVASTPAAAPIATPTPTPKAFEVAGTSWDVTWPAQPDAGTDHVTFHADGTVTEVGSRRVRGHWKATGRKFHFDWNDYVTNDGEVAADGSKITGTYVTPEGTGEFLALPRPGAAAGAGGGRSLPTCSEVTFACERAADARQDSCWTACDGDEGCRDACAEANRSARWDCKSPSNCE